MLYLQRSISCSVRADVFCPTWCPLLWAMIVQAKAPSTYFLGFLFSPADGFLKGSLHCHHLAANLFMIIK